jgi:hypothetical protein
MSLTLNQEFSKNPLAFFKKYPVLPPAGLGQPLLSLGNIYDQRENVDEDFKKVIALATDPKDKIIWADFNESKSMNEPGAMTFSGTRKAVGGLNTVPIYFLPWMSMRLVSIQLPELSPRDYDAPEERNPKIFFTAAINGCSVFVRGKPTAPEVFHAGIDGELHRDSAAFWRDCLARAVRNQGPAGGPTREVNRGDYTKDINFHGPARTPMAAQYLKWLQDEYRDKLTISEVLPWGCVFGIRYGRLWTFYLQENATVSTLEFVKKKDVVDPDANWPKTKDGQLVHKQTQTTKGFLGFKSQTTVYVVKRSVTRPMRVSEFYPGGPQRFISTPLQKQIV